MICIPCSSYSSLVTHSWWNVPKDAKIDPPNQPAYRFSYGIVGEWILIFCYFVSTETPFLPLMYPFTLARLASYFTATMMSTGRANKETYARHQSGQLPIQSFRQTPRPRAVPNHDDVLQQSRANVDVACHDAIVHQLAERHRVLERVRVGCCLGQAEGCGGFYRL